MSIPLLRLRSGLWNPGLYFGDIFFIPFLDLVFNQERELQLAYGGTLHLELKTGAVDEGYPLDLYVVFGMTLEGQLIKPIIRLDVVIPWYTGGYIRPHRKGMLPQPALRTGI